MTLTKQQRQDLDRVGNVPVNVDGVDCILVRSDVFERVCQALGDDWTHDELRASLARAYESSDWNDPAMDAYDQYDDHA